MSEQRDERGVTVSYTRHTAGGGRRAVPFHSLPFPFPSITVHHSIPTIHCVTRSGCSRAASAATSLGAWGVGQFLGGIYKQAEVGPRPRAAYCHATVRVLTRRTRHDALQLCARAATRATRNVCQNKIIIPSGVVRSQKK